MGLGCLLLWILRSPYLGGRELSVDEALFCVFGEMLKSGAAPYRDFYTTKPPGLLYLYELSQTLTPWSISGARCLVALANCITLCLIAIIARGLCFRGTLRSSRDLQPVSGAMDHADAPTDSRNGTAAVFAVVLFVVASSVGPVDWLLTARAEGFFNVFTTFGFLCVLQLSNAKSVPRKTRLLSPSSEDAAAPPVDPPTGRAFWWAVAWGVSAFLALTLKQTVVADFAGMTFGILLLVVMRDVKAGVALRWLAVGAGVALLCGLSLLVFFAWRGTLSGLVYCCLTYGSTIYISNDSAGFPLSIVLNDLNAIHPLVFSGTAVFGLLAAGVCVFRRPWSQYQRQLLLLIIWTCASFGGALISGRNYYYYFVQALPSMCVLVGSMLSYVLHEMSYQRIAGRTRSLPLRPAARLCFLVVLSAVVVWESNQIRLHLWSAYGQHAGMTIENAVPSTIGREIQNRTSVDERIFVWGFAPRNYYFAKRLPACSDPVCDFSSGWDPDVLVEDYTKRIAPEIRAQIASELMANRPSMIVDYSYAGYVPMDTFPQLANLLRSEYELVIRIRTEWWTAQTGYIHVFQHITGD